MLIDNHLALVIFDHHLFGIFCALKSILYCIYQNIYVFFSFLVGRGNISVVSQKSAKVSKRSQIGIMLNDGSDEGKFMKYIISNKPSNIYFESLSKFS